MRLFVLAILYAFITNTANAQTFHQFYADIVAQTSQVNVLDDLTTYENFGIKTVGSTALASTKNWITSRYQNLGYTDVITQPFTYSKGTSTNIIITKTGVLYPNTFLIIDAHYDSINGPGTNDNGTGTVLLLELARLLKDVETEYSIKFIHFSGEEDGLTGSQYYVNNTVIPQNLNIKLVFNIDEVGGVYGMNNTTVICERDVKNPKSNNAASNDATVKLAKLIELYSHLKSEISNAYGSDYIPFENNGEIITGLYEANVSPVNHTANDNLSNMDVQYTYEVIKGALGAALEFAVAFETLGSKEQKMLSELIRISLNPYHNSLKVSFGKPLKQTVHFILMDSLGKLVFQDTLNEQNQTVIIDSLVPSHYKAVFKIKNTRFIKPIVTQ